MAFLEEEKGDKYHQLVKIPTMDVGRSVARGRTGRTISSKRSLNAGT